MGNDGPRGMGGYEREVEAAFDGEVSQGDYIIPLIRPRCVVSSILADLFDDASMH